MRILGLSGLNHSIEYKSSLIRGYDSRFRRICQGMDAAAAILENGHVLAAAAEERFNREKHSNLLPVSAIRFCLERARCSLRDVDFIAHNFDYSSFTKYFSFPYSRQWYQQVFSPDIVAADLRNTFGKEFSEEKFVPVQHHLAHAASAFHLSGFSDALVLVADAMGEIHGISLFDAGPGGFRTLCQMPYPASVGLLYSLITLHLGFDFNADEYKTMGLAPYGNPERYIQVLESFIHLDGGKWKSTFLQPEKTDSGRETYENTRKMMSEIFFPPRSPGEEIQQQHMDLAASLQELTNRLMHGLVTHWMKETSHRNLCMAGGVALNCVANEKILEVAEVQDFFIQPAAGDDGSALGAALEVAARRGERFERMKMPWWGPSYPLEDLAAVYDGVILESVMKRTYLDSQQAAVRIAHLLAEGKVVALFQGAMEFGPRALGNRSILADPRDPAMRDRVNLAVKMRESFRPFAPAVLAERIDDFFSVSKFGTFPYMLVTVPVKEAWRGSLPAVTHVDGSARVQTVSKDDNPMFYWVLEAFGNLTGIPIVLNTSFNLKGEPIVCTPQQAVETFLRAGIDSLFLQNYELTKQRPFGSRRCTQLSPDN